MNLDVVFLVRIVIAAACGAAVGWEREWRHKPAGLRTYMLVAMGSAAFTVAALRYALHPAADVGDVALDPTRVIQGIVGGIGFLGAGAILHSGGSVEGLTTAAGVWVMGAIGVACGLGYYDIAITTTLLSVFIVGVMGAISDWISGASRPPKEW